MSVDCLYGHACARARTRARTYARPWVVQPVFRSNTESSCRVDLLMQFVELAVEPAGRLRRRSTIAGSWYCFRDFGVNKSNTRDILT